MNTLNAFQATWSPRINAELNRHLPPASTPPESLHRAMRYAILDGGKRLRPLLCLAAAEACGGNPDTALTPGLSVEILHAYTLVHDDLPCMDDDDLRRGKPSCHIAFGESTALLAGDALLTLAFECTASCLAPAPYPPTQFTTELAKYAGSQGLIGGQIADLESENLPPNADLLHFIHTHKTADLITAALRMGAISASAAPKQLQAITTYGQHLGLAFQIADDILDETQSSDVLGKPAGSDQENKKCTYPLLFGLDASKKEADRLLQKGMNALKESGLNTPLLQELADRLVNRSH